MKLRQLLLLAIVITSTPIVADAGIITFRPGNEGTDAYLDSRTFGGRDSTNFGTTSKFRIGHTDSNNSNFQDGLIQFDLSSLPTSGVTAVELLLSIDPNTSGAGTPTTVRAHQITSAWDETTVTWQSRPSFNSTAIDSTTVSNTPSATFSWDVTSLYNDWQSGTSDNFGLYLQADSNNGEGFDFLSSDSVIAPLLRPALQVTTSAVPEPSGALLLTLVSLLYFARRPRGQRA